MLLPANRLGGQRSEGPREFAAAVDVSGNPAAPFNTDAMTAEA